MGFYIQDDFWEACEGLPRKEQDEVFGALVRLFFEGDGNPPIKGASKAVFIAFRDRVLLAKKKSEAGRSKRDQNDDQNAIKRGSEGGSERDQTGEQSADQNAMSCGGVLLKRDREKEKEKEREKNPKGVGARARAFAPPDAAEVAEYAASKGFAGFDAERFIDYYAAQGWRLSNGVAMKDWRAAVRNWVHRDADKRGKGVGDAEFGVYASLV